MRGDIDILALFGTEGTQYILRLGWFKDSENTSDHVLNTYLFWTLQGPKTIPIFASSIYKIPISLIHWRAKQKSFNSLVNSVPKSTDSFRKSISKAEGDERSHVGHLLPVIFGGSNVSTIYNQAHKAQPRCDRLESYIINWTQLPTGRELKFRFTNFEACRSVAIRQWKAVSEADDAEATKTGQNIRW